jgi:ATP-binding cassette subfamily C protein
VTAAEHPAMEPARRDMRAALRLALGVGLLVTLGGYGLLLLKMEVYSLVLPTHSMQTLAGILGGFLLGTAALAGLDHARELALIALGNRLARRLAPLAIRAAASGATGGGDAAGAAATAMRDVEELRRAVSGPLATALLDATMVPLMLVLLLTVHPVVAAFGLGCATLALVVSLLGRAATQGALQDANAAAAGATGRVVDAMRCAESIEAMGMLPVLRRRWQDTLGEGTLRLRSAQLGTRLVGACTSAVQMAGSGGALLLTAAIELNGTPLGTGMLVAMLLLPRVVDPFTRLASAAGDQAAARGAWRRLDALLREPGATPPAEASAFPCPEGRLVLERLAVTVPGTGRPLFQGANAVIEPGQVVALTGPAGIGKSALLRVLVGARRPAAGAVFLDGHATWQWAREDIARHVGMLPQDPVLTEGSVAEAIARLGDAPDLAEVQRVARLAGADALIAALPQGYATRVGPDCRLSMGQRQRIALARALYGKPRILLLDEPAAWLDDAGEQSVLALIATLRAAGTTVIFTSHRPALIGAADRLFRIHDGQLQEANRQKGGAAAPVPLRRIA